jgi:hypothetical protein
VSFNLCVHFKIWNEVYCEKKSIFKIYSKLNWFDQLNFLVQLGRPAELLSWTSARLVFTRKPPGWNRLNWCLGPVEPVWHSLTGQSDHFFRLRQPFFRRLFQSATAPFQNASIAFSLFLQYFFSFIFADFYCFIWYMTNYRSFQVAFFQLVIIYFVKKCQYES